MTQSYQYLLVGSGKTHRHFSHYLSLLGISFSTWDRSQSLEELNSLKKAATHVLVLISDSAIESFVKENLSDFTGTLVHFSGALEVPGLISAHPLMTFGQELYELNEYMEIPFVVTESKELAEILPGLPNRHYQIPKEMKARYHAMCVIAGNFAALLWNKSFEEFQKLGLPDYVAHPFFKKTAQNIMGQHALGSLTGPLMRKDLKTVKANHSALEGDPFQKIYRSFVEVYFPEALSHLEVSA